MDQGRSGEDGEPGAKYASARRRRPMPAWAQSAQADQEEKARAAAGKSLRSLRATNPFALRRADSLKSVTTVPGLCCNSARTLYAHWQSAAKTLLLESAGEPIEECGQASVWSLFVAASMASAQTGPLRMGTSIRTRVTACPGYSGDVRTATSAGLFQPSMQLWMLPETSTSADTYNNRIRRWKRHGHDRHDLPGWNSRL